MTPHLCEKHQREWEETDEAVIQSRIRTHQARPAHQRQQCGTCRAVLLYPLFLICRVHAEQERLCQQCYASTLTAGEIAEAEANAAAQEELDRILDDYTLIIKSYGRRSWIADKFRALHADRDLHLILPSALDIRTDRPIWKEVLGPDIYQKVFCDRCAEERITHGFRKAAECGHTAIGRAYVLCHLCAVRAKRCAACGTCPVE